MFRRSVSSLAALCLLAALAGPALASDLSDAHKHAVKLKSEVDRAPDDGARAAARKELEEYCRSRVAALKGKDTSRLDLAYLGLLQSMAGMHEEAVATQRAALTDTRKTKYVANIHGYLVEALSDAGKWSEAISELQTMASQYAGNKITKKVSMNLGMALRGQKMYADSAKALQIAVDEKDVPAIKVLVNSYLLVNDRAAAQKVCEDAIARAKGDKGQAYETLLEVVKKFGQKLAFEPDAYAPGPAPDLAGKVKVIAVWNIDAGTLKWTMGLLENIRTRYAEHPVVPLAATTYYKKNAETREMDPNLSPEKEREQAIAFRDQAGFKGHLAFMKDEAALDALGRTALPYVLVLGKNDEVLFTHVMDRQGSTDVEILYEVIEKQLK